MITLIVYVAIIGLIVWAITTLIPMDPKFKQVIVVIAIVCVVLLVLSAFGLLPGHLDTSIPKLR
jgi:hypothetical protein